MRTFDDFETGNVFELGEHLMTEEEILEFARLYDPQPFHVDKEAAQATIYRGLIASGWQTGAIYMGLLVRGILGDTTSQGSGGIDELRWLLPVRAGDLLRGRMTITGKKPSERHPERGTLFTLGELFNQRQERVFFVRSSGIFKRRVAGMKEILPGILTWPWLSARHGYDFNGYLVRHPSGNVCIDPVEMSDAVLEDLAAEGVASIVLTNRNHYRASMKVRARTGARVVIHAADAAFAREKGVIVDGDLAEGASVGPFTVVGAPGKSPGEVALHWPARRLLLIGDACVGNPPGRCALLPPAAIDDLPLLRESLRKLALLDFDALLLGDGASILTGGRAALAALANAG